MRLFLTFTPVQYGSVTLCLQATAVTRPYTIKAAIKLLGIPVDGREVLLKLETTIRKAPGTIKIAQVLSSTLSDAASFGTFLRCVPFLRAMVRSIVHQPLFLVLTTESQDRRQASPAVMQATEKTKNETFCIERAYPCGSSSNSSAKLAASRQRFSNRWGIR